MSLKEKIQSVALSLGLAFAPVNVSAAEPTVTREQKLETIATYIMNNADKGYYHISREVEENPRPNTGIDSYTIRIKQDNENYVNFEFADRGNGQPWNLRTDPYGSGS